MIGALTVNELRRVWEQIKSLPPTCYAIWFVDRRAEYAAFRAHTPTAGARPPSLFDIQAYEWWSTCATADDWAWVSVFCREPGIYMRWSDGRDLPITLEELLHDTR